MPRRRRSKRTCCARSPPIGSAPRELAGEPIETKLTAAPGGGAPFGGIKVSAASGWFAARPSGTEAIYKVYAESFRGADHLRQIQQEAQAIVSSLFGEEQAAAADDKAAAELTPTRIAGHLSCGIEPLRTAKMVSWS